MMKYPNLSEAVKQAINLCDKWRFMYADELYDTDSFPGIAQVYDEDSLADEDSYYVVAPSGAIGFIEEGDAIEWLFLNADKQKEVLPSTIGEMQRGEPSRDIAKDAEFCTHCGAIIEADSVFCEKCGEKI